MISDATSGKWIVSDYKNIELDECGNVYRGEPVITDEDESTHIAVLAGGLPVHVVIQNAKLLAAAPTLYHTLNHLLMALNGGDAEMVERYTRFGDEILDAIESETMLDEALSHSKEALDLW